MPIAEKQQKADKLMFVNFYPVFKNGNKKPVRAKKENRTSDEQQRYNRAMAIRKMILLVNSNFTSEDFYIHPTFTAENEPKDEKEARKEIKNFFRRVKRYRENQLKELKKQYKAILKELEKYPESEIIKREKKKLKADIKAWSRDFKYIYAIEKANKWHFHLFMTGSGMTKSEINELWSKGRIKNDKYDPETFGPEAAAAYMAKDPKGAKSFAYSQNLRKPKEKKKLANFGYQRHHKIATERVDDKKYWERKYKGYKFLRCNSRINPYNNCWYTTVVLYRTSEEPPKVDIFADNILGKNYIDEDDFIVDAY